MIKYIMNVIYNCHRIVIYITFVIYNKILFTFAFMKLKEYLEKHKDLINLAELARRMYQGKVGANVRLINKLNETRSGTGIQRITEKDTQAAKEILLAALRDAENIE